jgi:uncharacterized protein YcaQ
MSAATTRATTLQSIPLATARRIVLAAQGFHAPAPAGTPDRRHLRRVLRATGLLQIDSVNVLVRAHEIPAFSRLGPYPRETLRDMAWGPSRASMLPTHRGRKRELLEYWGHMASLLPFDAYPLLRWRMARARDEAWGGLVRIAEEEPSYVEAVRAEVGANGPLAASEFPDNRRRRGAAGELDPSGRWWSRSAAKQALEFLFWAGEVACAGRTASFERLYDLPDRVLPADALDAPVPSEHEANGRCSCAPAAAWGWAPRATSRTTTGCRSARRGPGWPNWWRRGRSSP